jgi:hypothetical protein
MKCTPRGSNFAATWFQHAISQSLRAEIERLASFIRRANGLSESPTRHPSGHAQPDATLL